MRACRARPCARLNAAHTAAMTPRLSRGAWREWRTGRPRRPHRAIRCAIRRAIRHGRTIRHGRARGEIQMESPYCIHDSFLSLVEVGVFESVGRRASMTRTPRR